jgi:exodeoxyribonuclease V alpha subunit
VKKNDLERLFENGILTALDLHFARFISKLSKRPDPNVSLAAALVSNATRQGHICLNLATMGGRQLLEGNNGDLPIVCPGLPPWLKGLQKSEVVGRPGEFAPLIIDDQARVYLHRYWDYQNTLAASIIRRTRVDSPLDLTVLQAGLERLFPQESGEKGKVIVTKPDWQKIAAAVALMHHFCVISGGPGTGKTTTVAKILALMLEQPVPGGLRIRLAAPTGKAAARLQKAMKESKGLLPVAAGIKDQIPEEASTLHRLLGGIPGSPYFSHDQSNPLSADVVIVDEASMVDLALMAKLVQALHQGTRLVLLGDKDQLASVEAGAVLGDICDTGRVLGFSETFGDAVQKVTRCVVPTIPKKNAVSSIRNCIVHLNKNFRFGDNTGIGRISRAINAGDSPEALSLLKRNRYGDIQWEKHSCYGAFKSGIKNMVIKQLRETLNARSVKTGISRFDRFRVLCALRQGPYGVAGMNNLVEQILIDEGLIEPDKRWYQGRPILINSNDYNIKLYNGDVGIVWHDRQSDGLRVFFVAPDGSLRKIHPVRLPEHETAFAMTVHKSQGSEFNEVLLVLPDKDYPVLTRELLYTGITRARDFIAIWGTEEVLRTAIERRLERMSGLRDALWKAER